MRFLPDVGKQSLKVLRQSYHVFFKIVNIHPAKRALFKGDEAGIRVEKQNLGKWRSTLDIWEFLCYLSLQKDKVNVTLN
jgi:hypothetical protein